MTADRGPRAELDTQFSSPDAVATPWPNGLEELRAAEIFWLSTVRPDGRPHVTPLLAVWVDDALWFTTGPSERKARNLAANRRCVITTGRNALGEGLDVVVEGEAIREKEHATLQRVAEAFGAKYPEPFHYTVRDGGFDGGAAESALVFRIRAAKAFGFGRGAQYSQTRWRFEER